MQNPIAIKALYFISFGPFGILSPYLPIFFELLGLNKSQIGLLSMIPNISAFAFGPLWSLVCDAFQAHNEVMIISVLISTMLYQMINYITRYSWLLVISLLAAFFRAPIIALIDSFVMSSLVDKHMYGEFRLWGSAGFGIMALTGGFLTSSRKTDLSSDEIRILFRPLFLLATMFSIAGGMIVLYLVHCNILSESELKLMKSSNRGVKEKDIEMISVKMSSEENNKLTTDGDNNDHEHLVSDREGLKSMIKFVFVRQNGVLTFALIVFLSGFGGGVIDSFLFLRLKQLHGSGLCMGIARIITCIAELPVFQIAGTLQSKFGTWNLLALTQFAFVVRFFYYSELRSPWWVLPCEVLHGLTFALTWSVSCKFASEVAPKGAGATIQSALEGVHFGLGSGLGSLIGGFIYDVLGPVQLFRICSLLSLVACVLSILKSIQVSSDPNQTIRMSSTVVSSDDSEATLLDSSTIEMDND